MKSQKSAEVNIDWKRLSASDILNWVEIARREGGLYPPQNVRWTMERLLDRFTVKEALEFGGYGLFLRLGMGRISKGDLIGIYHGWLDRDNGCYSMQIIKGICVDGTPRSTEEFKLSRINDYIWDDKKQNCHLKIGGVIVALRTILPGEQLFMSYSDSYDWDELKLEHIRMIPPMLSQLKLQLSISGFENEGKLFQKSIAELGVTWRETVRSWGGVGELLCSYVDGFEERVLHTIRPEVGATEEGLLGFCHWLERVLRSVNWVKQFAFRKWRVSNDISWQWLQDVIHTQFRRPRKGQRDTSRLIENANDKVHELTALNILQSCGQFVTECNEYQKWLVSRGIIQESGSDMQEISHDGGMSGRMEADVVRVGEILEHEMKEIEYENGLQNECEQSVGSGNWIGEETHMNSEDVCENYNLLKSVVGNDDGITGGGSGMENNLQPQFGEVSIGVFNAGGLNQTQEEDLCVLMKKIQLDIVVIVDARMTSKEGKHLKKRLVRLLGEDVRVRTAGYDQVKKGLPGGQVAIISGRRIDAMKLHDEGGVGALAWLDFRIGSFRCRLITTYWPCKNEKGPESLWNRLGGSVSIGNLKVRITLAVKEARAQGRNVILGGDFNSDISRSDRYNVGAFFKTLQLCQCLNDVTWRRGQVESCIDYMVKSGNDITSFHVDAIWLQHYYDDHAVICGKYVIIGSDKKRYVTAIPCPTELPIRNSKMVETYQKRLHVDETLTGAAFVEKLQLTGPKVVDSIIKRRRGRNSGLWSPVMVVTKAAVCVINNILKRIRKLQKRHVLKRRHIRRIISQNVHKWGIRMQRLTRTFGEEELHRSNDLYMRWKGIVNECADNGCIKALSGLQHELRLRLQGRHRLEERMRIIKRSQERDYKCEQRQLGPVIRSIMGDEWRKRTEFDLSSLRDGDEEIMDGEVIQSRLTGFFGEWFAMLEDVFMDFLDGQGNLKCFEEGRSIARQRGIPDRIWEAVYEGLKAKVQTPIETLAETPTWEEFQSAVKVCKRGTAAGPSGFTYNMLKSLSEKLLRRLYDALVTIWESGEWPQSWDYRWLVPIPKKSEPEITDLRPLMLMECILKTWSKIFVRRISMYWSSIGIIDMMQHGGVRGRGTHTAILSLLNFMEGMQISKSAFYIMAYDIKRAFDTVVNSLAKWAYRRLGVPRKVVQLFMGNGRSIVATVRTPFALRQLKMKVSCASAVGSFVVEKGFAQGDVVSPLAWTAFFDILMVALRTVESGRIYMSVPDTGRENIDDIVYADDILTLSSSYEGLQQKADVISGFMIVAGMQLATNKFCGFGVNWGNARIVMQKQMVIHTKGWTAETIKIESDGCFKHLGVLWDLDLQNMRQFKILKERLAAILTHILNRRAAAGTKWRVIHSCVFPMIAYCGQFMGWSLRQFRELDQILARNLRKMTLHQKTFPTDLVFLPTSVGGLGFGSLTDSIIKRKMNFIRHLQRLGFGVVADMLVGRYGDTRGYTVISNMPVIFQTGKVTQVVWATSIVEWWEEQNVRIIHYGNKWQAVEYIQDSPLLTVDDKEDMVVQGIVLSAENDVISTGNGSPGVGLRRGQFWWEGRESDRVFEILHEGDFDVTVLIWTSDRTVDTGAILSFGGEATDFPCNASTAGRNVLVWLRKAAYHNLSMALLVRTSCDRHSWRQGNAVNKCVVLGIQRVVCREWVANDICNEEGEVTALISIQAQRDGGWEGLVYGERLLYKIHSAAVGSRVNGFRQWIFPDDLVCSKKKNLIQYLNIFFKWCIGVLPALTPSKDMPKCGSLKVRSVSMSELNYANDKRMKYGFLKTDGVFEDSMVLIYGRRLRNYLKERAARRISAKSSGGGLLSVTPTLAAKLYGYDLKSTVAFRGHITRIIWNKLLPIQDDSAEEYTLECEVCGECNSMEHAVFNCGKMGLLGIREKVLEVLAGPQKNNQLTRSGALIKASLSMRQHWGLYIGHMDRDLYDKLTTIWGDDLMRKRDLISLLRQIAEAGYRMIQLWQRGKKFSIVRKVTEQAADPKPRLITEYYGKREGKDDEVVNRKRAHKVEVVEVSGSPDGNRDTVPEEAGELKCMRVELKGKKRLVGDEEIQELVCVQAKIAKTSKTVTRPLEDICTIGEIGRVTGNGNCFFYVVSDYISGRGTPCTAIQLRDQVVRFIGRWTHFFDTIDPDPLRNWEHHITNMSRNYTWATQVEIIACAELFGLVIYVWTEFNGEMSILEIVRPMVATGVKLEPLHMLQSNGNHFDWLIPREELRRDFEDDVRRYNEEIDPFIGEPNLKRRRAEDDVEILGHHEEVWEMGCSNDGILKVGILRHELVDIDRIGQSSAIIWALLKESNIGVVLYGANRGDRPENVKADGYCGYRAFDAVRQGMEEHLHRLDAGVVLTMRQECRRDCSIYDKCERVAVELWSGKEWLDEAFWFRRGDFEDIISPVYLMLWTVAYDERFNVVIGVAEQGHYMMTGETRRWIVRDEVVRYERGGGRDIVYAGRHFYLGQRLITLQRFDEALLQIAQRLWRARLTQVAGLEQLKQEMNIARQELYYAYYPP